MIVSCELDGKDNPRFINALICVYTCKEKIKLACPTYAAKYEEIKTMLIENKYLTKYGIPSFPVPKSLQSKKERKNKGATEEAKSKPEAVEIAKPKRKRRTKAEMEEARKK
jgi:hypothetical protein